MDKKKVDIIAIFTIVTIFAIFSFASLKNDIAAYRSLRHKRSSLKDEIRRDTYTIGLKKKRIVEVLNLEKEITEQKQFLLANDGIPDFLNYISSLARRHKVEIVSIEPGETMDVDLLTKTIFTAELRGGFSNIYNFLFHLEDDWRGVKVEELSIESSPEERDINIRMTLAVLSINGAKEKA